MTNKDIEIHLHKLKFYRNYCASRTSCILMIIFSPISILFLLFNALFGWDIYLISLSTNYLLKGMIALAICYTVFYAKTVSSMKYFKIKEQLSTIYKISTAILVVMWVTLVFEIPTYFLSDKVGRMAFMYEFNELITGFFIAFITISGCLSLSLIVLSSVGLSKYSTYGKEYEIFSEYKQIK